MENDIMTSKLTSSELKEILAGYGGYYYSTYFGKKNVRTFS